ncbi:MAG: zraR 8 [Planctomycetota bacterium]|nr:zraR 8 [Planctomycetota bacterium]
MLLQLWRSSSAWVILLSFFIVLYSVTVIWTVANTGDPGIRCVFGKKVKEVAAYQWLATPSATAIALPEGSGAHAVWSPKPPEVGDSLVSLGERPIVHYTDYVRSLREVRDKVDQPVEVLWEARDGLIHRGQVLVQCPPPSSYGWSVVWFFQEMVIFAVGARVFWMRPRDASARVFFWLCVVTVGAFMGGYHWSQIVVFWPLIFLFAGFAVFVPVMSLHFYLVFPRANPILTQRPRLVLSLLYGAPFLALAGLWGSMSWSRLDPDGKGVELALALLKTLALGYVVLAAALFVVCFGCLYYSYKTSKTPTERNQVRYILLATLLSFLPITWLLWDALIDPARLGMTRSAWPMFLVSMLYTLAYALSITRYRLMQAERLLNRGVVYVVVSVTAGLLYSGGLVIGALLIGDQLLDQQKSMGTVVACLTAIMVLILSGLARQRFQTAIDRRFHREKYKFDQAMKKMSLAVDRLVDRETLGRRLLDAAGEVLRVEWGAIYLAEDPGSFPLAACCGPEPEEKTLREDNPLLVRLREDRNTFRLPAAISLMGGASDRAADAMIALGGEIATPLQSDGQLAGVLVLGPKRSGMPYEDEELAFLAALGSVATLAIHSSETQATLETLNQDLREKVDKIAEQQRRILILQDQLTGRAREGSPAGSTVVVPSSELPHVFGQIKGTGPAVRQMLEVARKVAASPSAVLILGESGTGKELLADAIHSASARAGKPFVKVHCAALSQNLLESELFGHVKSAFTGADRDRVGRFQQADGGTLFLDEIGDINLEVQTKLLRVLQEMAFERVGSSQTISVDVRIIAATHQNLAALIEAGRFREDLYYRLNVISIRTPSLRERREDIFELAVHFLGRHAQRVGKSASRLDDSAIEALVAHDWPGNIRELENVIERAVVLSDGPALGLADLPVEVRRPGRRRARPVAVAVGSSTTRNRVASGSWAESADEPIDEEAEAYERRRLVDALEDAGGVKSEAARLLGMPRSTFFSKLKKHGLA